MTGERNISVKIDALGNPTIEANNFHGTSCTEATAPIEKALTGGSGDFTQNLKGEYYEQAPQEQQHQSWN